MSGRCHCRLQGTSCLPSSALKMETAGSLTTQVQTTSHVFSYFHENLTELLKLPLID